MSNLEKQYSKEDIKGIECKHAVYIKGTPRDRGAIPDDLVFVKEKIHMKDGSIVPNTRSIINYERPFWITKKAHRTHNEKKEWEQLEKLDEYKSTQAGLVWSIKKALGNMSPSINTLRQAARNPYLYGCDISTSALIKRYYMDKWPECKSDNTIAVLDIETDVNKGHGDPIYIGVSFKEKILLVATQEYVGHIPDYEEQMKEYFYQRIPKMVEERNLNIEVRVGKDPLEAIKIAFERLHEWQPDFLSIWNMNFDIPKIIATIEKYGGDPGDIFSDPSVPKQFRNLWYKEGQSKKVTSSGKEMPLHWVDRWHTLYAPSSFYVIDQPAVFRRLRIAAGMEPSYGLDPILKKYTNVKKLKNEKADTMSGLEWHQYMQANEPLEYGVYNIIDCVACEILDEQPSVRDLSQSISVQIGHSDYANFANQPRRTVDDMHFDVMDEGYVIATTSDEMRSEFDDKVVSIKNWIVTLPTHMVVDNGIKALTDIRTTRTYIRALNYDLDVAAAYPNGEDTLNASKATTVAEVNKIEGVNDHLQRMASINLTGGVTNAVELCQTVMNAPTLEKLSKLMETEV